MLGAAGRGLVGAVMAPVGLLSSQWGGGAGEEGGGGDGGGVEELGEGGAFLRERRESDGVRGSKSGSDGLR